MAREEGGECGVRVITHPWNRGYGAALKTGVLNTEAAAIMIMDADCSYPPDAIPKLIGRLDQADMVVGRASLDRKAWRGSAGPGSGCSNTFASYLVGCTFRI
jgi:glycosyltransferase involved in cell wall biosynthesis